MAGACEAPGRRTPRRRAATSVLLLGLQVLPGLSGCADGPVAPTAPEGALEVHRPWALAEAGEVGMDPQALARAAQAADATPALRALVVIRRGRLVLERYYDGTGPETPADGRSTTKSVVSLLTGIALEQGHLQALDQPVAPFLRAAGWTVRAELDGLKVEHLLAMTAGFDWPETTRGPEFYNAWVASPDPVAFVLDRPLAAPPGSAFAYNSAAVHLLGVVLEEATGRSLPAWADEVLFGPLGMAGAVWEPSADGRVNAGSGLDLRPRDLARLGQLLLQRGWSGDRSVVPEPWVDRSTRRGFTWIADGGAVGPVSYGLLWWVDLARDAYFAEGYRGQFLYVVPDMEMVVVATSALGGLLPPGEQREGVASLVVDRVLEAVP